MVIITVLMSVGFSPGKNIKDQKKANTTANKQTFILYKTVV